MIRFIDLREQGLDYRFSFWDTVTDSYIKTENSAWDTWGEFEEDAKDFDVDIVRCKKLCPSWVNRNGSEYLPWEDLTEGKLHYDDQLNLILKVRKHLKDSEDYRDTMLELGELLRVDFRTDNSRD